MHLIAVPENNFMDNSPPSLKNILEFQNKSNVMRNACKHFKSGKLDQKMKLPPFPQQRFCRSSSNPKSFLHYAPREGKKGILLSPELISLYCELSSEQYWYDFNRVYRQHFLFLGSIYKFPRLLSK